jgi:hypothetical protein
MEAATGLLEMLVPAGSPMGTREQTARRIGRSERSPHRVRKATPAEAVAGVR